MECGLLDGRRGDRGPVEKNGVTAFAATL